jgi:hypothetical protein
MQPGDIITAVNDVAIDSTERFRRIVRVLHRDAPFAWPWCARGEVTQNMEVSVTLAIGPAEQLRRTRATASATARLCVGHGVVDVKELNSFERDLFGFEKHRHAVPWCAMCKPVFGLPTMLKFRAATVSASAQFSGGVWRTCTRPRRRLKRIQKDTARHARVLVQLQSGRGVSLYKVIVVPPAAPTQPARTVAKSG